MEGEGAAAHSDWTEEEWVLGGRRVTGEMWWVVEKKTGEESDSTQPTAARRGATVGSACSACVCVVVCGLRARGHNLTPTAEQAAAKA